MELIYCILDFRRVGKGYLYVKQFFPSDE